MLLFRKSLLRDFYGEYIERLTIFVSCGIIGVQAILLSQSLTEGNLF